MQLANSASLPSSNGSKFVLNRPVSFDDGLICERIRIEALPPIRNPSGGNLNITNADVVSLFGAIFGNMSINFGGDSKEVVDNALPYAREREMHAAMTQRDHFYVPAVAGGFGGELRSQGTESALATTNYTPQLEFHRSFVVERMGHKQTSWCPGAAQMRQLDLSFVRGAVWVAAAGSVTENGAATINVIFDAAPARGPDRWTRVPRIVTSETSGLESQGPDGGGCVIALWHYNAAAGSTGGGLGLCTISRDGLSVHNTISATRITRDEYTRLPLGGYDLNGLATMLLSMPSAVDIESLWVGGKWQFKQHSSDLSPPKLAWLYVPPMTEDYRDSIAGPNIVGEGLRSEALLVVEPTFYGDSIPLTHTSVMPLAILDRANPRFGSSAGRLFQKGRAPITVIPPKVAAAVQSSSDADMHASAVAKLASQVPGGASPEQGKPTATMAAIAQAIAAPELKGRADFSTGLASRLAQVN